MGREKKRYTQLQSITMLQMAGLLYFLPVNRLRELKLALLQTELQEIERWKKEDESMPTADGTTV
ncbi:MAG TPA: hypothetical protein PLJ21_08835, partial [Pseudobdellovibrionaceae bacterium]|nr:hypothetical protein [Pseudobdellovibrionaceae bacterium]